MGFKMKFKAPKLSVKKVAALVANPVAAASTMAAAAQKDVKRIAGAQADITGGMFSGNLGKVSSGFQELGTTLGQVTGLVKRPGDMPDVAGQMPTTGTEPPSLSAVTEDQNDLQRKELGRRFASRQLFGGMSGMSSMGRSSSLLGF